MTPTQRSILAVAMLTQGVSVGLTYGIFPVFLEPLEVAFEAPRTLISSGQVLMMLALSAGSMAAGAVLDKGHARKVMLAGALLLAAALGAASLAQNLVVLGVAAFAAGFAVPSVGPLAGASLITRYFDGERGRALGLMSMGPPLGAGLCAALAGVLLPAIGWRESYLVFAGLSLVLPIPLILWAVPSQRESVAPTGQAGAPSSATQTMGSVVGMPLFWWTAGIFALSAGISTGWTVHVAAFLGEAGLDETQRSAVLAGQFWMGVPGALVFGTLADRASLTSLFLAMLGGQAAILATYAIGVPVPAVVLLGVLYGFLTGGMIPLYMMLLGRRMGPDSLGRAMGLSNIAMLPVMALSVWLAAAVFEREGGYSSALIVFAAGMLVAIGSLIGSNRSAART